MRDTVNTRPAKFAVAAAGALALASSGMAVWSHLSNRPIDWTVWMIQLWVSANVVAISLNLYQRHPRAARVWIRASSVFLVVCTADILWQMSRLTNR